LAIIPDKFGKKIRRNNLSNYSSLYIFFYYRYLVSDGFWLINDDANDDDDNTVDFDVESGL